MTNNPDTAELIKCLEWMIANDETNDIPSNGYWIEGLERAKRAVANAKGEEYAPDEWENWEGFHDDFE